ncbi:hypothetical protein OTERR_19880 [Oryzomicrobium terrae]|uniref:Glyoxalase-like domain-containing protein n=1 Tax=Oryzomicrobium terrae TaxID=1735038 RepID=A0A5C1E9Z3_9RHOO|nr:VOC family protein [Oryzomicrobium terrae]QEL65464.1 hypothetical protein OTERR_19880 [Oryzomicrobium terrae]
MPSPAAQLDHVVINVADQLDQAAERYRRLGFTLTPRGHHSLGSSNHLAIFGNDYLELLGYEPQNAERAAAYWGTLPGLAGLVFKSQDSDGLFRDLTAQGVALDGTAPAAFFRPVELPDGSSRNARFRTVRLDPAAVPNGRIFFCHHLDPDLVWRPEWQRHANGVTGLLQAVVATQDPAASIDLLARTFGSATVSPIDGGQRLTAGRGSVDYLVPDAVRVRFGDTTLPSPDGRDRQVALVLQSVSLAQTRDTLTAGGIAFDQQAPDQLVVPAREAFGVALAFRA